MSSLPLLIICKLRKRPATTPAALAAYWKSLATLEGSRLLITCFRPLVVDFLSLPDPA